VEQATAEYLTGEEGRDLLRRVAEMPGDTPARVLSLRKKGVSLEAAAAAVEVAEARKRARRRFADADSLFFTDESLAQATSPGVASYHARRLAPFGTVADLCCGVGMDAVALAEAGAEVVAVELDPARLAFARANAAARGVAERITFVAGDVTTLEWAGGVRAAFFDPARRGADARRVSRHGDRYAPPLSFFAAVAARTEAACAKLSPALPDDELAALGRVEFLSEGRECKEACVWSGALAGEEDDAPPPVSAVFLPEGTSLPGGAIDDPSPVAPTPGAFLLDPDPAVVRAHALPALCERAGAALLSYDDAYLTADAPPPDPRTASAYRILETLTYHPKTVGSLLRGRGAGRLVLKKRHFPKEPDAVARELGLNGRGDEATLVLVRTARGFLAVLCEPAGGRS
jgi:SAM-dependent methyltransferase